MQSIAIHFVLGEIMLQKDPLKTGTAPPGLVGFLGLGALLSIGWWIAAGLFCPGDQMSNSAFASSGNSTPAPWADERDDGRAIYQQLCQACHGDRGQGSAAHDEPLRGELSLEALATYIADSMPEEDPDLCIGDDARQVAQYIFHAFYSHSTDHASGSPALDFSRLTVRQFRESVADVLGNFAAPPERTGQSGLQAHYFAARHWTGDRKLAEQIDPTIDFAEGVPHFDATGEYAQLPKKEKPDENKMNEGFSVYWSGALIAPYTGQYTIMVRSRNGFQLRLNGADAPLIDRKVRSDDIEEHTASIFLLGGRAYPLRIEFFSYPDPPARIQLLWIPPHGAMEVIPSSLLMPEIVAETPAIATSFPPDDASAGYERGTTISREWDEAVTAAALEVADWVGDRLWRLAGTADTAGDRTERIQAFCEQFVAYAFAHPLDDRQRQFFVRQHFELDLPLRDQVQRVVLLALKSPWFLYPELAPREPAYAMARRLALVSWDSIPDRRLSELAQHGSLTDAAVIRGEIQRMLHDPRGRAKMQTFFESWLKFSKAADVTRDPDRYPQFDARWLLDLRRSLEVQLDHLIWEKDADFRQLLLADDLYVNDDLAQYYGVPRIVEGHMRGRYGFYSLGVGEQQRAGVLTHPYLMTALSYYRDSSPIHRGVFVARSLLGRPLRPPMENFEPLTEEFDPSLTNRQRVEYQTSDAACLSCHRVINPLGFALEHYDAVGRFRTSDRGHVIDATAEYETPDGKTVTIRGARDLAEFIATDETAQRHFIRQLFRHYTGQPVEAYGPNQLTVLHEKFVDNNYNILWLASEIIALAAGYELDQHAN